MNRGVASKLAYSITCKSIIWHISQFFKLLTNDGRCKVSSRNSDIPIFPMEMKILINEAGINSDRAAT